MKDTKIGKATNDAVGEKVQSIGDRKKCGTIQLKNCLKNRHICETSRSIHHIHLTGEEFDQI